MLIIMFNPLDSKIPKILRSRFVFFEFRTGWECCYLCGVGVFLRLLSAPETENKLVIESNGLANLTSPVLVQHPGKDLMRSQKN